MKMSRTVVYGAALPVATLLTSTAYALDAGECYSAEQVRAVTWDAPGDAKQYTLIQGDRTTITRPKNFFTSTRDGSVGYNMEKDEKDQICIRRKYTDVRVNTSHGRPKWVSLPKGSNNEKYISAQEQDGAIIVMTARSIVNLKGKDYLGSQIIITKNDTLIDGFNGGAAILNNPDGTGDLLVSMMAVSTNPDIYKFPGEPVR